jgi:Cys-rich protein (TIGR01571 family)
MRHKYDIEGTLFTDTLLYVCCAPCALAQEANEMDHRYKKVGDDSAKKA